MATAEDELRKAVDRLSATVDGLRLELVRKDVYDSDQRAMLERVDDVKNDVKEIKTGLAEAQKERNADRRLLIAAFVSPLLLLVVQLYLASQGVGS